MLWLHLIFWNLSIYNPLSEGFPKTDCHAVSNSMSSIPGVFTLLCIEDKCCFISWNEMILISDEMKTSQRE